MSKDFLKLFIIAFTLKAFLACKGQVRSESKTKEKFIKKADEMLSENVEQIWSVFQDSKRNYWFGSDNSGVYCYDGKSAKRFTTNDGLMANDIRDIQEDDKGNILIETPKGISIFNGHSFESIDIIQSPSNKWILEPNDLWFNFNGNSEHAYRYDGRNLYELRLPEQDIGRTLGIYKTNPSFSPYSIYGINMDKKGNLWIGTLVAGAFRFDGSSFLWVGEEELSTLKDGRVPGVRSMLEDKNGYMWLSNFKSKYKINSNSEGYEKIKTADHIQKSTGDKLPYFNSGLIASNGDLWMTTYHGGVWIYDGESLENYEVHNGRETVLLITIYQDRDGIIWLGTRNDGVYKQDDRGFAKFDFKA